MRKELLGAISAFALLTGTAFAQDAATQPSEPPAAGGSATIPGDTATSAMGETGTGMATDTATTGTATTGTMDASPDAGVGTASVDELMGRTVVGADGEEIGEVSDVILDPQTGEAQRVVLSSGGFLGLGAREVAVDFSELQVQADGEELLAANLTREQVQEMPEYEQQDGDVSLRRPADDDTADAGATATGTAQ